MKKLKILFQCPRYLPDLGGIQISTQNLASYLIKRGHEVSVMCERTSEKLKPEEKIEGVNVYRYPKLNFHPSLRGFSFLIHQKVIEKFNKEFFKKHNFDVIISRFCFFVKPTKKYAPKTPLIYLQPSIAYVASIKMLKFLKGLEKINRAIKVVIAYFMEKKALKLADKILARSKAMVEVNNKKLGVNEKKQGIFPQAINLKKFKPRKNLQLKKKLKIENKKVILTVSRLSPEKGVGDIIKIYKNLKTKNVVWIIVGDGNQREELVKKIKEEGIKGIYFVGEKKNTEDYYNISDIYVLPSQQEGFPNVLLEAMASGLPCIAFKSNPPKIILPDELLKNSGFAVKNEEEMAEKIDLLLENEKLRKKMSGEARKQAEKYSLERIGKSFLNIIEEVVE